MRNFTFLSLVFLTLFNFTSTAQTLDVENSGGGAEGEGYFIGDDEWQSFTAGTSGALSHIDIYIRINDQCGFCGAAQNDIQILLYEGEGLLGTQLGTSVMSSLF